MDSESLTLPTDANDKRRFTGSLLLVALAFCLPLYRFSELFSQPMVFAHQDLVSLLLPIRAYFFGALLDGVLPLLYPNNIMGTSLAANPHYGVFDPLQWPFLTMAAPAAAKFGFLFDHWLFAGGLALGLGALGFTRGVAWGVTVILLSSGVTWSAHIRQLDLHYSVSIVWAIFWTAMAWRLRRPLIAAGAGASAALAVLGGDPLSGLWALSLPPLLAFVFLPKTSPRVRLTSLAVAALVAVLCTWPILKEAHELFPLTARALSFPSSEVLSYSTPWHRLLEAISPTLWPTSKIPSTAAIGGGEFWYPSVVTGFIAAGVYGIGIAPARRRPRLSLLVLAILVPGLLAVGSYFSPAAWLWMNVPGLSSLRFPEKLLRLALIASAPLLAVGLQRCIDLVQNSRIAALSCRSQSVLFAVVCASVFETSLQLPPVQLLNERVLRPPHLVENLLGDPSVRLFSCAYVPGTSGPDLPWVDGKRWGLSVLSSQESIQPPLLKRLSCGWLLQPVLARWLGLSHVFSRPFLQAGAQQVASDLSLQPMALESGIALSQIPNSGASLAWFSPRYLGEPLIPDAATYDKLTSVEAIRSYPPLRLMAAGTMLIDPRFYLNFAGHLTQGRAAALEAVSPVDPPCSNAMVPMDLPTWRNSFQVDVNLPCPGVISFPWAFVPGWRISVNKVPREVLRIGDTTIGVHLEAAGPTHIDAWFEPEHFLPAMLISLLTLAAALYGAARSCYRGYFDAV